MENWIRSKTKEVVLPVAWLKQADLRQYVCHAINVRSLYNELSASTPNSVETGWYGARGFACFISSNLEPDAIFLDESRLLVVCNLERLKSY